MMHILNYISYFYIIFFIHEKRKYKTQYTQK